MRATRLAERTETSDVGILYVVARNRLGLYDYLTRHFTGEEGVEIILDRRQGERRSRTQRIEAERRVGERRSPAGRDNYLNTLGYMIVGARGAGVTRSGRVEADGPQGLAGRVDAPRPA